MSTTLTQPQTTHAAKSVWVHYPSLYEINTWVWLTDLSAKYGKPIDLSSVPSAEWDAIAAYGFNAVWLMGVWERSPAGIAIANQNHSLLADFRNALPDFRTEDNVGSAYSIRRYVVDAHFGGPAALATARAELAKRGMNLVLDFVPNHVAPDNPWSTEHPEYFIEISVDEAHKNPASFISVNGIQCACGRDPYFPPWPDVLQLNAFSPQLRQAVIDTLSSIAEQCDGVRCDMAMILLNSVFERTWGTRVGPPPATEYWSDVITAIKKRHPGFVFIAEAYWDLEWQLQQLGFNFCYDKKLYDRLEHGPAETVRLHLCAAMAYQAKLIRFIENHDEPRAAAAFSPEKERAVAVTTFTLPGAKLYYEGQLEGRSVRPPVFLDRRPSEPVDQALHTFYVKLLAQVNRPLFHDGLWSLLDRSGWPDNATFQNLIAWSWQLNDDRCLIAVNLSDHPLQALVHVPWAGNRTWDLTDVFDGITYRRDGNEMASRGLYVEVAPWAFNFFRAVEACV